MKKKKMLILNRRCIKNPLGGGAEIYTHEIFKRLTNEYDIVHFSSSYKGAKAVENIDNIKYLRKGGELSMHFFAWLYYITHRKKYDIIIEQFNGIGFMTFFDRKSIMLIHQLYKEFWHLKLGRKGFIFHLIEKILLKCYNRMKVITVSESTKEDLLKYGFVNEKIFIVYNGINYISYEKKQKFSNNIGFLGRLEPTKNPKDACKVYDLLKEKINNLKLHFIGDGSEKEYLKKKYLKDSNCIFYGYVSEEEKYALLRNIDVLLVPSIREGWGQVVIQANMMGTPVIGYNVSGIKDSIVDGYSGILVNKGNINDMANAVYSLLKDKRKLIAFSCNALKRSSLFSWEKSAADMSIFLKKDK